MKNRSLFMLIVSIVISIGIIASPVWAGNVQRNRWEGVAIGIGAAILGKVIFDHVQQHRPPSRMVYGKHRYPEPDYYPRPKPFGHWETRRVWVSPVYKRVWNPGHYNRRGRWVSGRWIKIEKQHGYWKEERIWVSERPHASYYR